MPYRKSVIHNCQVVKSSINSFRKYIETTGRDKVLYLILMDVSQVSAMNDPCNFIGGDIFLPIVNRNGFRIHSCSVEPESDSFKTPLNNTEEGKNKTFNLFEFVWSLFWRCSPILTNIYVLSLSTASF